jgi:hypothetical protein
VSAPSSPITLFPNTHARLGEVVETSTTAFVAESERLHDLPELGSLARVRGLREDETLYGVVAFGETGGLDAGRRAVKRGNAQVADSAVYAAHPELEYVLRTLFTCAAVGSRVRGVVRHTLPALPAPLHFNVQVCALDETRAFCVAPRYLSALLHYQGPVAPEQLVAGHLRWVDGQLDDGHVWLADATRRLARLMKRDYDRLVIILEAIDPS